MFTRLLTIWDGVRSSLWALPFVMVAAACLLAYAALNTSLDMGDTTVWWLFSGSDSQAPEFLSSLMTAMITMATLAISITMVVLTLAAQQLGPRLIRSFMGNRRTQISLGLFIGTVVYLLLVLRSAYGQDSSVSNLAITTGTALVLICVATLLLFVHHLAQSIIADNVIDRVGRQLDDDILRMMPEKSDDSRNIPAAGKSKGASVALKRGGYIQAVDFGSIVEAATQADARVDLALRAGQNAIPGSLAAHVTPASAADDDALCGAIQNAVLIGHERTDVQDIEYSIHQLVEVALRALSTGINDAYTAIAVIDRLTLSIALIMTRCAPRNVWKDDDGKIRVVSPVSSFEGITDAAFHQIRQQGSGMPAVLIRMADDIGQLLAQADDDQRPALEKHLRLVVKEGKRSIEEEEDLKDLETYAKTAAKAAKP